MGSVRLSQIALGSSVFAWSIDPNRNSEGLGWLVFDAATMRVGPLLHGTVIEGLDHTASGYSWLYQTSNAVNYCQVPMRC